MSDLNYNRREFIALTSLALSASRISKAFGETSAKVQCLAYDDQGQPLSASGFARFHLCDSLMRPFTIPFEATSGQVRFTLPDKPFRIGMPLSVPRFGQVFVYADDGGRGYTARSLARSTPLVLNYAFARDRMATVRNLVSECKQSGLPSHPKHKSGPTPHKRRLHVQMRRPLTGRRKSELRWSPCAIHFMQEKCW